MQNLHKIIEIGLEDHYTDKDFNLVYPNRRQIAQDIAVASDSQLEDLYNQCVTMIKTWCSTPFKEGPSRAFINCEFPTDWGMGIRSAKRAFVHGLYARICVERRIRKEYSKLSTYTQVSDLEYYHKDNWGKCIIFTYRDTDRLMSSDHDTIYYYHNDSEYSLSRARPMLTT